MRSSYNDPKFNRLYLLKIGSHPFLSTHNLRGFLQPRRFERSQIMPFPKIKCTAITPKGNSSATLDELAEELDYDIYRAPTHLTAFVSGLH